MKDQVPVVLLNQWLGITQEKSCFANKDWCQANADEYSVYSSETMSQVLSITGRSVSKAKNISKAQGKRNSQLLVKEEEQKDLIKLGATKRRMTILK